MNLSGAIKKGNSSVTVPRGGLKASACVLLLCGSFIHGNARAQESGATPTLAIAPPRAATPLSRADKTPAAFPSWWSAAAVIVGLASLGAATWFNRRSRLLGSLQRPIQIVDRALLGNRSAIYLVRVQSAELVIGTGAQGAPVVLCHLGETPSMSTQPGSHAPQSVQKAPEAPR